MNIKNNTQKNIETLQQIEKKIKKNNLKFSFKSFFKPLYKEVLTVSIGLDKKKFNIIISEDEYNDVQKITNIYKELGLEKEGIKKINIGTHFYKNIFDLLNKRLKINDVLLILKVIGQKYKLGMSNIKDVIIVLDIPLNLKKELIKSGGNIDQVLGKYEFPGKMDIISKIKVLSDGKTIEEKGKGYLEIVKEIESKEKMKKEIKSGLLMPIVILIISLGSIVMINEFIFPIFIKTFGSISPGVLKKITENYVYIGYHYVKKHYIYILGGVILLAAILKVISNILVFRNYMFKFLLKVPIIGGLLIYREFLKFINVLIGSFKYNQQKKHVYLSLQEISDPYYALRYFTYDKIYNTTGIIDQMIKEKTAPKIESVFLLSLIKESGGSLNLKEIELLKEQIEEEYLIRIKRLTNAVKTVLFIFMVFMVIVSLYSVYGSLYGVMEQIN